MNKKKTEAVDEKIKAAKKRIEEVEAAKKRRKAEASKKKREAVAITASLMGSKKPEELCQDNIKCLAEIASDIITGWEDSSASTIDIECLKENCPQFGVLDEGNGRKIYAIFDSQEGSIIKKLVVPLFSGVLHDEEKVVPLIEKHFSLIPLHRKKTTT